MDVSVHLPKIGLMSCVSSLTGQKISTDEKLHTSWHITVCFRVNSNDSKLQMLFSTFCFTRASYVLTSISVSHNHLLRQKMKADQPDWTYSKVNLCNRLCWCRVKAVRM